MNPLLTVSLRQNAVYIPANAIVGEQKTLTETTGVLTANFANLGFGVTEPLLLALNNTSPAFKITILDALREVMGVRKNWTPLVKGWNIPTGESVADHILTFFTNIFKLPGTKLPCGHTVPANTFPLERYNGCPFCGTPFQFGEIERYKQGSEMKVLELWTLNDAENFLHDLLTSKTALDATQLDSLKLLLTELPLPAVQPAMKETLIAVIDILVSQDKAVEAAAFFNTPADVLRYLWYKHTGFLQIIEPSVIVKRSAKNNKHIVKPLDGSAGAALSAKAALKLKYTRKDCFMVASWLNNMPLDNEKMCEIMHPKRGIWVRFIRALRLAEYSKRAGFEKLRNLLDKFYNENYEVWQAAVNNFKLRLKADETLRLLQQRPGLFARSLFATMLWFGNGKTIAAFAEVIDKLPARLIFTLNMYADNYFDKTVNRVVKPLGGVAKNVPANKLLKLYSDKDLEQMKTAVMKLCIMVVQKRFEAIENANTSMYIHPVLFKMPVSIGDRAETVQDLPSAVMGTRFEMNGEKLRLFMQWGAGLPAQHMDMDLSCTIAYEKHADHCSYSRLVTTGCKHSGDIRSIPDKIGTAEYIEMDVAILKKAGAKYVAFTCNAYSNGSIAPNLTVGWMNSKYPMHISEHSGVAYDPSCVQHQVRVVNSLSKGIVFGVLDVDANEIVWLELPFGGQVVQNLDKRNIDSMLKKLNSKLTIGQLLRIKAGAQNLNIVDTMDEADEVYTGEWARNTAAVTQLLVD